MAYVMGQVSVASTSGIVQLFSVPAGLCNVTFYNTAATVYIGTGTAVTATNGLQCHSIPTNFFTYVGSRGATFYGTAPTGTGVVNYIISTDF